MKPHKITTFWQFLRHYEYNPIQFDVWYPDDGDGPAGPITLTSGTSTHKDTKLSDIVLIYGAVNGFSSSYNGNGTPSFFYNWFEVNSVQLWRHIVLRKSRESSLHGVGLLRDDYRRVFFQDEADAVHFRIALEERQWQT